jgi:hypothetical protein
MPRDDRRHTILASLSSVFMGFSALAFLLYNYAALIV